MRTRMIVALSLVLALGACDSGLSFVPLDPDTFVIQVFLFTGEPVAAVSVTGVLPIDAESTEVPEPISDARITLIKADHSDQGWCSLRPGPDAGRGRKV